MCQGANHPFQGVCAPADLLPTPSILPRLTCTLPFLLPLPSSPATLPPPPLQRRCRYMAAFLPQLDVPGASHPQDVRLVAGWPPDSRLLLELAEQVPPEVRGTLVHSRPGREGWVGRDGWLGCSEYPVLALAPMYSKPREAAAAAAAAHPAGPRGQGQPHPQQQPRAGAPAPRQQQQQRQAQGQWQQQH
jgi:hypothetical protein